MERERKGSGEEGSVGGCGTLERPRDSGLGQDAERVVTKGRKPPLRFLKKQQRTGEVERRQSKKE